MASELFSDAWIKALMGAWNDEPEVSGELAKSNFDAVIGAGFKSDDEPKVYFKVEKGMAVEAGLFSGQDLDWDMRADPETWAGWQEKGIGMAGLAASVASGKLKFKKGDYATMIKNPKLAGPFSKCFNLMQKI